MTDSRKTQKTDVLYVTPAVGGEKHVFFTPDGEGRIWFDSLKEAKDETGITNVVYLTSRPQDD